LARLSETPLFSCQAAQAAPQGKGISRNPGASSVPERFGHQTEFIMLHIGLGGLALALQIKDLAIDLFSNGLLGGLLGVGG
jgi:hypothetical protein